MVYRAIMLWVLLALGAVVGPVPAAAAVAANPVAAYPVTPAVTPAVTAAASVVCIPLRIGYIDQHRPPYWMGEGEQVPEPPGAAVDLMRDAARAAGFGCAPTLVRLPPCLLYTSPSPRDLSTSRMPSSA